MNNTNTIKAIIFDFDDTLVLTRDEVISTFKRMIEECDLPEPEEDSFLEMCTRPLRWSIETFWPFADLAECEAVYRKLYRPQNVTLVPGMKKTLEKLREAGFELHILTSRNRSSLLLHLEQLGLRSFFTTLVGFDDIQHHKPDPRAFSGFLTKYKTEEIIYVGDSINDVQAAKLAGIYFVGVCTGSFPREGFEMEKADVVLESVAQLDSALTDSFITSR